MSTIESFTTIQPANKEIQKYISYYYFHSSEDQNFKKSFTFYPNYKHGLTVYLGSNVDFRNCSNVTPGEEKITVLYTMNYEKAIQVNLNGPFNKIGVAFEAGGINHFVKSDLKNHYNSENHLFSYFGDEFEIILKKIYSLQTIEEKRDELDRFFESKLIEFKDRILLNIVTDIIESGGTMRIEDLSLKYSIHRKTILRLFQKHFCCSPEAYKKMVKFRNTLNFTQKQNTLDSLTEISLFNNYYDQADFNKQIKAITNCTPKELFTTIEKVGEMDTYWRFENN